VGEEDALPIDRLLHDLVACQEERREAKRRGGKRSTPPAVFYLTSRGDGVWLRYGFHATVYLNSALNCCTVLNRKNQELVLLPTPFWLLSNFAPTLLWGNT
jgi:hypothetical protein